MGFLHRILGAFSKRYIYERRIARRRGASVTARFRIRSGGRTSSYVDARTHDMSASGVGLEASAIRVDGLHVYDSSDMVTPTRLDVELELPGGRVALVGETVRYDTAKTSAYRLGVRILTMEAADAALYQEYVRGLR